MSLFVFNHCSPKLDPTVFVAPTAVIIGNVWIGADSSVWFQSVIRGDLDAIRIGERTNIQDLCTCHADAGVPLTIGDGVTVGHRSVLHGCVVEADCLIGMGAIVMNRAVIGTGSVVAAGSVVLENTEIPPFSLVAGSPGIIKKTFKDPAEIRASIQTMSRAYMDSARQFASPRRFYPTRP